MKGVHYIKDQNGNPISIQIDLKNHDEQLSDFLEDLLDVLEVEARKGDQRISWEEAQKKLAIILK